MLCCGGRLTHCPGSVPSLHHPKWKECRKPWWGSVLQIRIRFAHDRKQKCMRRSGKSSHACRVQRPRGRLVTAQWHNHKCFSTISFWKPPGEPWAPNRPCGSNPTVRKLRCIVEHRVMGIWMVMGLVWLRHILYLVLGRCTTRHFLRKERDSFWLLCNCCATVKHSSSYNAVMQFQKETSITQIQWTRQSNLKQSHYIATGTLSGVAPTWTQPAFLIFYLCRFIEA